MNRERIKAAIEIAEAYYGEPLDDSDKETYMNGFLEGFSVTTGQIDAAARAMRNEDDRPNPELFDYRDMAKTCFRAAGLLFKGKDI